MCGILSLIFLSLFLGINGDTSELEIHTQLGNVQGRYFESSKGRIFRGFTGIPYAKPPVENLRFKAPVSPDAWPGILDATKPHEACPQINLYHEGHPIDGNEDCLYLNVYSPSITNRSENLLPVMFYIHGGSFIMGSARNDWLGPELLLDKDIVLVTTNYRLGSLGFLSTGDDVATGNNGLKDQSLALTWVKNNIDNFGGDPSKITIFGNSAGAISTHLHTVSPLTRNLIQGAIVQSGSAFNSFTVISGEVARARAQEFGRGFNCTTISNTELVNCLRQMDVNEILIAESKFVSWDGEALLIFNPIVEEDSNGAFLTEYPVEVLKAGNAADVPMIIGIVANESAYKTADYNKKPILLETMDKIFAQIVPLSFGISTDLDNYAAKIRNFYFQNNSISNAVNTDLTNMYMDGWFLYYLDKTTQLLKQHLKKPVYQYLFNYRGSTSYSTLYGDPNVDYGTSHTDELIYLFKLDMWYPNYQPTEEDKRISELMITLWTNFAHTGMPTPSLEQSNLVKWDAIKTDNLEYYHINKHNTEMAEKMFWDRTQFWRSLPIG